MAGKLEQLEQLNCGRLRLRLESSASRAWPMLLEVARAPLCQARWGPSFLPTLQRVALWRRKRNAAYLQRSLPEEFWGGSGQAQAGMRKVLEALADLGRSALRALPEAKLAVLDVGAASYEGPDRCHAADMAVLLGCSPAVQIHAFEPLPQELRRTQRRAEQKLRRDLALGRRAARRCVSWQQRAASNVTGTASLRGSANQASLSRHIPAKTNSPDYSFERLSDVATVATQRLDDFAQEAGLGPSLLLKVDTEGHDMEVLPGAQGLLERGEVAAIVFEVAGQMNRDFFRVHKESHVSAVGAKKVQDLTEPTLRSMVQWLRTLGYESFLLGSRSLIPLTGSWWDESFEICWSRPELACWYDVLALPLPGRTGFWSAFPPRAFLLQSFVPI